jgi:DNA-binding CsgD family transcriptional regulator
MIYHKTGMDNFFANKTISPISSNAFLLYRPKRTVREEMVFYNREAWHILSLSDVSQKKGSISNRKICSICSKWKSCLEKNAADNVKSDEEEGSEVCFIELIKSGLRHYTVRGVILSGHEHSEQEHETMFMFILERVCPDRFNLPLVARQWKLNKREQDLVRLLLEDKSNKEIAQTLGLSIDTIKGYMKLLMRKLGVTSRTGIIASLLTKKRNS